MGSFFSNCKPSVSEDQEPLLENGVPEPEVLSLPETLLDNLADAFAALHAGKLPSQDQITIALQKALKSDFFQIEGFGYGPLSKRGEQVLADVRELIEAILRFGMEKNNDDKIQDLVYQIHIMGNKPIVIDVDKNKSKHQKLAHDINKLKQSIPSTHEVENDVRRLTDSVLTIARLIFTSQTFRLLLSDVILTCRSLIADIAEGVSSAADTIGTAAQDVEEVVRPKGDEKDEAGDMEWYDKAHKVAKSTTQDVKQGVRSDVEDLQARMPEQARWRAIDRIQKVLSDAAQTPAHASALRTMLILARSYIDRFERATTATHNIAQTAPSTSAASTTRPVVATIRPDPHLSRALEDLRIVLERLAGGYSLCGLIAQFEKAFGELASSPELKKDVDSYLSDIEVAFDKAFSNPDWIGSPEGRSAVGDLYDRGRNLTKRDPARAKEDEGEAQKFLNEFDTFVDHLKKDATTRKVIRAFDMLSQHSTDLFRNLTGAGAALGKRNKALRRELWSDLLGWVLPRVSKFLKTLPIPRIEVRTEALEAVLEGIVWETSASFVPDHVVVQNSNQVRLEIPEHASTPAQTGSSAAAAAVQTVTRTQIHLDGLRMSAHDVGYYIQYFGLCGLGWEDAGFMNLDIGKPHRVGQGLSITVDLEIDTETEMETTTGGASQPCDATTMTTTTLYPSEAAFHIADLRVSIPGLHVVLNHSRHWLVNTLFVQPLGSFLIRRLVRRALEEQIRTYLERIDRFVVEVRREVVRRRRCAWKRASLEEEDSSDADAPWTTTVSTSWDDYWTAICYVLGSRMFLLNKYDDDNNDNDDDDDGGVVVVESDTHLTPQGVIHDRVTMHPTDEVETVIAVGTGPQILPGREPPKKKKRKETVTSEGAQQAAEAVRHITQQAKQVSMESGESYEQAKRKVRGAQERRKARGEAERGEGRDDNGWRSHAFDIS